VVVSRSAGTTPSWGGPLLVQGTARTARAARERRVLKASPLSQVW
jgi:hypothetical protein